MEPIPKYCDNIGYPRYGETWLSGITTRQYFGYPQFLAFLVWFLQFLCVFCLFCIFWVHFAWIFYVFNNEDFWCAFIFDFYFIFYFFCVHFLHFFLLPIVDVDISDIAITSVIPDMVKAIISGITNTPQKTYCIAQ